MAEGDGVAYNCFKKNLMDGIHDLGSGGNDLKLILVSSYSPNIDTHTVYADVSSAEYSSGSGYTAGGLSLTGQSTVQDNTNDQGVMDADDGIWAALGPLSPATPSHVIMYDNDTTTPTDALMAYWEIGTTATTGGNYAIEWATAGIFLLA